jgi:hypothetical protein
MKNRMNLEACSFKISILLEATDEDKSTGKHLIYPVCCITLFSVLFIPARNRILATINQQDKFI